MPVEIIKKSKSIRKSAAVLFENGKFDLQTKESIINPNDKGIIHKLEFVFKFHNSPNPVLRLRENYEYLAWINSPVFKQAQESGWQEKEEKLPNYDNDMLFLPHHMYYNLCDTRFLKEHCQHIQSLAPESFNNSSSGKKEYGRAA